MCVSAAIDTMTILCKTCRVITNLKILNAFGLIIATVRYLGRRNNARYN